MFLFSAKPRMHRWGHITGHYSTFFNGTFWYSVAAQNLKYTNVQEHSVQRLNILETFSLITVCEILIFFNR